MTVEYTFKDQQGREQTSGADFVAENMKKVGYPVTGITPDGMSLKIADQRGEYEVPIDKALKEFGNNIIGVKPENADTSNIQHGWRAVLSHLDDDGDKKAFLEAKMRNLGHEAPQIVGSGRDWYGFNPKSNQWVALTNDPEWDLSDLTEAASMAPRTIASAVGGGLGLAGGAVAGGGVGSVPLGIAGGALGAAAGGAGADMVTRGLLSSIDPQYHEIFNKDLGKQAGQIGKNAAVDALLGGATAIPGARGLAGAGVGSQLAKVGGAVTQGVGKLAEPAGKLLQSGAGQFGAEMLTPGLAPVAGLGYGLQTPREAIQMIPKGAGWLSRNRALWETNPAIASWLRNFSKQSARGTTAVKETAQQTAEKFARGIKGGGKTIAEDLGAETLEPGAEHILSAATRNASPGVQAGTKAAGKFIDALAEGGKGITDTTGKVIRGAGEGLEGAGAGLQKYGAGIRRGATYAQPFENRAYGDAYLQEKLRDWRRRNPNMTPVTQKNRIPQSYLAEQ